MENKNKKKIFCIKAVKYLWSVNTNPAIHSFYYKKKKNAPVSKRLKDIKVSQLIINTTSIPSDVPSADVRNLLEWSDQYVKEPIGLNWTFTSFSKRKLASYIGGENKTILCLFAVNPNTDKIRRGQKPINREKIVEILEKNGFQNTTFSLKEYFQTIQKAKFVISPEGNGEDCHRHYEAWIAGAIPIIEKNEQIQKKYKNLPYLLTKDYSEITPDYLKTKYQEFQKQEFDYSSLCLDYYPFSIQQKIVCRSHYWIKRHLKSNYLGVWD